MFRKILGILGIIVLTGTLCSACGEPRVVINGDMVKVHYTGTLSDGTQFDSSEGKDPLEFTVGAGQMIKGFDNAVRGMKVGETKTVTIPAAEAYGERKDSLVITFDLSEIPDGMSLKVGDTVPLQTTSGGYVNGTVTAVSDTDVTVDANHRLAGKDLTFEITLVEIE